MKRVLKPLKPILLSIYGISIVYVGWHLTKCSMALPVHYLNYSPFNNNLLSGILCSSIISLYGIALFTMVLDGVAKYKWHSSVQGISAPIWNIAQLIYRIAFSLSKGQFLSISAILMYTSILLRGKMIL